MSGRNKDMFLNEKSIKTKFNLLNNQKRKNGI